MTDFLYLAGGSGQQPSMACPDYSGATRLRLAGRVLADADALTAVVGHQDTTQFFQSISSASVFQVKVQTSVGGSQIVNSDVSGVDLTAAKTWIMADVDTDAGTVDFYYSVTDTNVFESVVWTQVGAQKSLSGTGETFVDLSASPTWWGATNHVGSSGLVGQMHVGVIEADGVVVSRVDFTNLTDDEVDAAEFVADSGQTVTLNGTAWWYAQPGRHGDGPNGFATPTGNSFSWAWIEASDFGMVENQRVEIVFKPYEVPTADRRIFGNRELATGWECTTHTSGFYLRHHDSAGNNRGSTLALPGGGWADLVDGEWHTLIYEWNQSLEQYEWSIDGVTQSPSSYGLGTTGVTDSTEPNIGFLAYAASGGGHAFKGALRSAKVVDADTESTLLDVRFGNLSARDLERAAFSAYGDGRKVTLVGDEWAYVRPRTSVAGKTPELLLMAGDGNDGQPPLWADRSGNGHHAQLGSVAGADTNDPVFLNYENVKYAWTPGTAGSIHVPNTLDADDTDVRVRFKASLDVWDTGGNQSLFSNAVWNSGGIYILGANGGDILHFIYDGTVMRSAAFTAEEMGLVDGVAYVFDFDYDAATGDVTLVIDGVTIGTKNNSQVSGIKHTTTTPEINFMSTGPAAFLAAGTFYYGEVWEGGTKIVDIHMSDADEPYATFTDRVGNTVTLTRATSGYLLTVVDADGYWGSTDDYVTWVDAAWNRILATDDFTAIWCGWPNMKGAEWQYMVRKGVTKVWRLYHNSLDGRVFAQITDGTNSASAAFTTGTVQANELQTVAMRIDRTAEEIEVFYNGVASGFPGNTTAVGDVDEGADLRLGFAGDYEGGHRSLFLIDAALTDDEILAVSNYLLDVSSGSLLLLGVE